MALLVAPATGTAGDHEGLGGHGAGIVTHTKKLQRTAGGLVKQTTQDVWIWDNPPVGCPTASNATCYQFTAFGGATKSIGGAIVCRCIDSDGDVTLNNGTFIFDRTVRLPLVAATGKWAPFAGAARFGTTDIKPG